MAMRPVLHRLLHKVEKKIRDLGIFTDEGGVSEEDSTAQTQNTFSGNSETLLLAFASLCQSCQA